MMTFYTANGTMHEAQKRWRPRQTRNRRPKFSADASRQHEILASSFDKLRMRSRVFHGLALMVSLSNHELVAVGKLT